MFRHQQQKKAASIINNYFQNAIIAANQFHAGDGSNTNNPNTTNSLATTEVKDNQLWLDCKELKTYLKKTAEQNSLIEQVNFLAESSLAVKYVPLRMVQVNRDENIEEDRNAKKEINDLLNEKPDDELQPETFFEKSRESAKDFDTYKNLAANPDATEELKETLLNKLSNIIFVVGHAGIGKTCLTKKYLQLVKNQVSSEFIFYIKFRDVDYEVETSLMTFLTGDDRYESYNEQRLQRLSDVISNSDNVTLVLDGMDEAQLQIDGRSKAATVLHKKAKAQDFILGLLNSSILCKSKKLFTSRPKQLFSLPKQYQPFFIVKLLGIDKTSQKSICENICGDDFDAVFKQIRSNSDLSNYCSVPLICIIIVYCLYKYLKQKQYIPCTLTEIFVILICMYIRDPTHTRGKLPLQGLCELAFSGVLNQKLYFNHADLKKFSLDEQDQNNFTVTVQYYNRADAISFLTNATLQYTYFSHLIVQEWFAALYLMIYAETKEFEKVLFSKINLRSTNFDAFVTFLFGLSNESMLKKYYNHFPYKTDLKSYSQKVDLLKKYVKSINDVTGENNSVYCWLYELKDENVTQQVADKIVDEFYIDADKLLPNNIVPLKYVFRCRKKKVSLMLWSSHENLWINRKKVLVNELEEVMKQNINIKIKFWWIRSLNDKIISQSIFHLQRAEELRILEVSSDQIVLKFADAVMQREHPLKKLELVFQLNDKNVSAICSCLANIEELKIYDFLSEQVAQKFTDAVKQLEHPMKKLGCFNCSEDTKQILLLCQENVEELIVNSQTIQKLKNNKEQEIRRCFIF